MPPSLLIVPARFKSGKMYSQIPTSGDGDFTVTRNLNTATRVNASGYIESVASGIPRLDYFASGGVVGCPALLVEPSGSNTFLYSTDTKTNFALGASLSSGAINVIGVSGINITVVSGGSLITQTAGRYLSTNNNVSLASGSTYTFSFLMKKTGTHTIGGYRFAMSSGAIGAGFNVSGSFASGDITNSAPTTNRIRRIEQYGTDVYRCSETFTMTATATAQTLAFAPLSGVTLTNNSAVGTSMGFAAPQLELGPVPTSFIPTTTAAVTRNADVITVSGAVSGSIGQTEGTVYAEFQSDVASDEVFFVSGQADEGKNMISIKKDDTNALLVTLVVDNQDIFNLASNDAVTGMIKMGFRYANFDSVLYVNGSPMAVSQETFGFTGQGLTNVSIDKKNKQLANNELFASKIRAIALYDVALDDGQLTALTTL